MWGNARRPSDLIADVLSGKTHPGDAKPAIWSACQIHIHEGAVAVAALPTLEARRKALARIPDVVRPYVQARLRILWESRDK